MKSIRYLLEYILAKAMFSLVRLMSFNTSSYIGSIIGKIYCAFPSNAKNVAMRNLDLALPTLSLKDKNKIIKKTFDNFGRTLFEMPKVYEISDEEFRDKVNITTKGSIGNIPQDLPFIVITGHFGNWEIAARALSKYKKDISVVYRDANNEMVNKIYKSIRSPYFNNIPKNQEGTKRILKSIKEKHCICFLADQKLSSGIPVPFFSKDVMTAVAPMKLALKANIPVLFGYCFRRERNNFEICLDGPYSTEELLKGKKNIENKESELAKIMNKKIESWIKKDPSQWFWVHRRWDKSFYK